MLILNISAVTRHLAVVFKTFAVSVLSGTVCFLRCNAGAWYEPGTTQRTHTCSNDGKWIPDVTATNCKPITCKIPTIPNSLLTVCIVTLAFIYIMMSQRFECGHDYFH